MNVLIAGGGTGGHLFPGVALAQEIESRGEDYRVVFVGTKQGIEYTAVPKAGFSLELLPVSGLRSMGFMGLIRGLIRLPIAILKAFSVVRRIKPSAAISVGGYAAGPAVLASRLLGVPCFVMEQNAIPGFTNRVLGRFSRKIFAALPLSGVNPSKVMVLGNPVRSDLQRVRDLPYAPADELSLFVFGGSQGARPLNQVMPDVMQRVKDAGLSIRLRHQTGKYDIETVKAAYGERGITDVDITVFIDDMAKAYEDADLVLCRSGATSIAELTVCGRPSLLVPFPFAVDDHQTKNAQALEAEGAAIHIAQSQMNAEMLFDTIKEFSENKNRLADMAAKARACGHPAAAKDIADALIKEVGSANV